MIVPWVYLIPLLFDIIIFLLDISGFNSTLRNFLLKYGFFPVFILDKICYLDVSFYIFLVAISLFSLRIYYKVIVWLDQM